VNPLRRLCKVVREIEEGDLFGERAPVHGGGYRYDALAKDSTQLLSFSGEAVLPFFESRRKFRRVLAKTKAQGNTGGELATVGSKLPEEIFSACVSDVMRRDIASLILDQTINEALTMFRASTIQSISASIK